MSTPSTERPTRGDGEPVPPAQVAVRISEFIEVVGDHIHEVGAVPGTDHRERGEPDAARIG